MSNIDDENPLCEIRLTNDDWEKAVSEHMTKGGWIKDRDDVKTLGFSFIEGDKHWMRDYDKKTRRFVQFNGNQKVNLICKKQEE